MIARVGKTGVQSCGNEGPTGDNILAGILSDMMRGLLIEEVNCE
jgi:hypothetical protein